MPTTQRLHVFPSLRQQSPSEGISRLAQKPVEFTEKPDDKDAPFLDFRKRRLVSRVASENYETRVMKFDDKQNSSQFSGAWHGNISDSGQPTGALILPLKRSPNVVT
jgi:hypothetical protein